MSSATRKIEIQDAIRRKDPKCKLFRNISSKSCVWKLFANIKYDGQLEDFVCCIKCHSVYTYMAKNGTGNLVRHKCTSLSYRLDKPNQSTVAKVPPSEVSKILGHKQLNLVAKDLLPSSITEGAGFREYAQALLNLGAEYGYQNYDHLAVSQQTLTDQVMICEYNILKVKLKTMLAIEHPAFSTDMWTDINGNSFMCLSAHNLNEEFDLNTSVLGIKEIAAEENSAADILDHVDCILKEFGLRDKLENGVIVTDNSEINISAFNVPHTRISCSCHKLNLVMDELLEMQPLEQVNSLIENTTELASYLKLAEPYHKLTKLLNQEDATNWSSTYIMLDNFVEVRQEIESYLFEKNELELISEIDFEAMNELIAFLKLFKMCSEKLSSEKEPTIHTVPLWYEKLKKHCTHQVADSEFIRILKTQTIDILKNLFRPTIYHLVALFLYPPFRRLKLLTTAKKVEVMCTVRSMLAQISEDTKNSFDEFDEFLDIDSLKRTKLEKTELETELDLYISTETSNDLSVLEFWKNANHLKLLQILARNILCIPASSSMSERIFSTSSVTLSERRRRLSSSNLEKIIFLNKNM